MRCQGLGQRPFAGGATKWRARPRTRPSGARRLLRRLRRGSPLHRAPVGAPLLRALARPVRSTWLPVSRRDVIWARALVRLPEEPVWLQHANFRSV